MNHVLQLWHLVDLFEEEDPCSTARNTVAVPGLEVVGLAAQ